MQKTIFYTILAVSAIVLASCSAYEDMPGMNGGNYDSYYDGYYGGNETGNISGDKVDAILENPFVNTSEQPISTFSVDADGASYSYMRAAIQRLNYFEPLGIRIEEFLNYFTFDYASPTDGHSVALNGEIGVCPWNNEHYLMRLGMKGKELQEEPLSNYVFMIDVSGSMNSEAKIGLLKSGLIEMVNHLNPTDRISIVTYSGEVRLALESTLVKDKSTIIRVINSLMASGATAGGAALQMAYEEAWANYIEGGNNRIIMGTDGDFNVGVSSTSALLEMVESYRDRGIYMTVCGFGMGNLNDAMMEQISNHGNGTYVYVDSEEEMMKVFVNERSHFFSVANDCKTQVTFDSTMVAQYRLIGYENRVMANEDFANDSVDAAEIGAGQTITALYEIVPTAAWQQNATCATFDFRYKESLSGASIPLTIPVSQWVGNESENLNFAAGVAAFGMILRGSEHKGNADLDMAYALVDSNRSFDPYSYREQLTGLILRGAGIVPVEGK